MIYKNIACINLRRTEHDKQIVNYYRKYKYFESPLKVYKPHSMQERKAH
jgi:hypothetical protein